MKFLHTSDWHLGRQFHNVSLVDDQRFVLKQLLTYVETEAVDAVVIAGDIYDRAIPPATAVALLDEVLHQLCEQYQIPVILIPGNHDSAERLGFAARQLQQAGVHIMADLAQITQPVMVETAQERVAFYGIPYHEPIQVRQLYEEPVRNHHEALAYLTTQIRAAHDPQLPAVLVSHCFVDGAQVSDSERPLSLGGSSSVSLECFEGFDYVALGHMHSPQQRGLEHVRYSGSLLKYSFSEQHQRKAVTVVELQAGQAAQVRQLPLQPRHDMRVLEGELATLLQQGQADPQREDYLLVRLTDRHAIMNAMQQLREAYPNVLHLEKPGMLPDESQLLNVQRQHLQHGELAMCRDFFRDILQTELTSEQDAALCAAVEQAQAQ